jgi:toxin FitB
MANKRVVAWADNVSAISLFVSAITIGELEIGILLVERRDRKQGAVLRKWLNDYVLPSFAGRILAVDTAVALRCAQLHVPNRRSTGDAFIAATALVHGMMVVTRNVADFEPTGVEILNPWK